MASRFPSQRVPQPSSAMTGDLGRWGQQVADAINAMPKTSYTSYTTPNSQVTGGEGEMLVNLASLTTTPRLWLKEVGSGNTGWASFLTSGGELAGTLSSQTTITATQGVIGFPYGAFCDTSTQTFSLTTVAYPITFNTDEYKSLISHSTTGNPSRIGVTTAGVYLITYSACVQAPSPSDHCDIWLRVDGVDVARTNTKLELPLSGEALMTVTYLQSLATNQYFELVGRGDAANLKLVATAAGSTPTRPVSPSIICTVNKISQ